MCTNNLPHICSSPPQLFGSLKVTQTFRNKCMLQPRMRKRISPSRKSPSSITFVTCYGESSCLALLHRQTTFIPACTMQHSVQAKLLIDTSSVTAAAPKRFLPDLLDGHFRTVTSVKAEREKAKDNYKHIARNTAHMVSMSCFCDCGTVYLFTHLLKVPCFTET